jgi:AraC family transcriptional regulator
MTTQQQSIDSGLRLLLLTDPPGSLEVPGLPDTIVSIHMGASVQIACRRGGQRYRGVAVHGDVDIIPAHTPSLWQLAEKDTALVLSLSPKLLHDVTTQLGFDPQRVEIINRFQLRDQHLESLGWALKAEMDCGYPSGPLYLQSLATAVATRLITSHSTAALLAEKTMAEKTTEKQNGHLAGYKLRQVLAHIEEHLSHDLTLNELAALAGLSSSHFKTTFRTTLGLPVHQYVIRRRVERAKTLLAENKLSLSQVALETGFAHQSHLAYHMRRLLGVSPKAVRNAAL